MNRKNASFKKSRKNSIMITYLHKIQFDIKQYNSLKFSRKYIFSIHLNLIRDLIYLVLRYNLFYKNNFNDIFFKFEMHFYNIC